MSTTQQQARRRALLAAGTFVVIAWCFGWLLLSSLAGSVTN